MAAAAPGAYKLLANKYYVDEIYGATVVKPLLGFSKYVLGWVVDVALLGGAGVAAGRHCNVCGRDLAALAIGQSALVCGMAGGGRGGGAAVLLFRTLLGAGGIFWNSPATWTGH